MDSKDSKTSEKMNYVFCSYDLSGLCWLKPIKLGQIEFILDYGQTIDNDQLFQAIAHTEEDIFSLIQEMEHDYGIRLTAVQIN